MVPVLGRVLGAAVVIVTALALATPAPGAAPVTPKTGNDPFVAQLKKYFDTSDLDSNGLLDTEELAKAFRGPKAVAPTEGMYDDNGKLTKTYFSAQKKNPELIMLWSADSNADGLLSWPEYRDYELKLLAARQNMQQQMQQAQQRAMASSYPRTNQNRTNQNRTNQNRRVSSNQNYRRPTRTYTRTNRNVYHQSPAAAQQRAYHSQQAQAARALSNWQQHEQQARANYLRAYQNAVRQRAQQQQQVVRYIEQHRAAAMRLAQEHWNAVARALQQRRRR